MDRVCPLLGLAGDRRTAVDGVDGAHRCHAEPEPAPIEHRVQAQRCLTATHVRCERYLGNAARTGRPAGARALADGYVATRLVISPEPAWRGIAGRARRAPRGPLVAAGLALAAVGVGGVAAASAIIDGRLDFGLAPQETEPALAIATGPPEATPRSNSVPETSERAAPSPSAAPSAPPTSAAPSAEPTSEPTAEPTAAPTSSPAPQPAQQTYVVQEGDTLAAIAEAFGTSIQALQEANGIDDPDEIVIGETLVIP